MKRYQVRGLFFEQLVRKLVNLSGYRRVSTGFVTGRGEQHQIDAFGKYGFTVPFVYPIRLICEAKWLDKGVHLNHVRDFEGVIKDISENYFSGRGVSGKDFLWRLLNRYCDCGAFFSATSFTDRAQNYAYAQGIFLVPYEGNSICQSLLEDLGELIEESGGIFEKKVPNMAESRMKIAYSKKARNAMKRHRSLNRTLKKIGSYLGMLDGIYPIHILTESKVEFDIKRKDDYGIWIKKNVLDITERSLHFEFIDENNNILEFTLPVVVGRGLLDVVRKFYRREAFSYIDIPVTLEAEGGELRRIFKAVIGRRSRETIHRRLCG